MATPINTTNVALSELNTAPGGGTGHNMRFANMARPGWSEGPLGSNSFTYYTWGLDGTSGGLDAIYGLTPTSGQFSLDDFKGLQYYFDGSPFDIQYKYANSLMPTPPPNIFQNDINIDVVITDSALNYSIFGGANTPPNYQFSVNAPANTSQNFAQIPGFNADTYPLVKDVYWIIRVTADPFFGGGQLDFSINGSLVFNLGISPGQNTYDYTTAGANAGATNASGIQMEFSIF